MGRSPRREGRRTVLSMLAVALALPLGLLWPGGVSFADPSPSDLQKQLRQLNGKADLAVEEFLEAQLGLKQTRAGLSDLRRQLAAAEDQLRTLRNAVSARAADAYKYGPADMALVLSPGSADDALDRMQTLNLLAERSSSQLSDLRVAEQAYEVELARLSKVEREREAQVKRLAAKKDQVDRLLARTQDLLGQLRQRAGAGAVNGIDPGVPVGKAPPPPSGGGAAAAVRYAYAQVGKPYQYGADGPGSFDCSGLTMMAWRQAGIDLPHSAAGQYSIGRHVSQSELQPGDLIFRYSPISHVAIYIGNGLQIAATHTGSSVKVQSAFTSSVVGFSRPNG
ncbi:MAG TPA: NlpC/P60 family protein [Actinomycetes bacterium]|nr:NlpC/P60 family protein [Actinomycetes bacterium]